MTIPDDTSRARRSRRKQPKAPAAVLSSIRAAATKPLPQSPRNLEEAIENVRTLLVQIRAMLHCLSEVLLHAEYDDSVLHAEVAHSAAAWANLAAAELDLVKLRPLIEAIRERGSESLNEGEADLSNHSPYQVREPMLVYFA